jgi:hypothetical protein
VPPRTAPTTAVAPAARLAAMRTRVLPRIAAAALALVLATASAAVAQQTPTLGSPAPGETQTAVQQSTTSAGGGGLATWQEVLIFGAGLILVAGIAFAILGDARQRASRLGGPATDPAAAPHKHKQRSKQHARAKAKAARAQRRRNR